MNFINEFISSVLTEEQELNNNKFTSRFEDNNLALVIVQNSLTDKIFGIYNPKILLENYNHKKKNFDSFDHNIGQMKIKKERCSSELQTISPEKVWRVRSSFVSGELHGKGYGSFLYLIGMSLIQPDWLFPDSNSVSEMAENVWKRFYVSSPSFKQKDFQETEFTQFLGKTIEVMPIPKNSSCYIEDYSKYLNVKVRLKSKLNLDVLTNNHKVVCNLLSKETGISYEEINKIIGVEVAINLS